MAAITRNLAVHCVLLVTENRAFILTPSINSILERALSRTCLDCGMDVPLSQPECPKCDALLSAQTDGSVLHIDVAHQGETVAVALSRLKSALEEASRTPAGALRVVVGGGRIREEVGAYLAYLRHAGEIVACEQERGNRGAFVVTLKRG